MIKNYSRRYEVASSDSNFPARIIFFDKAAELCRINRHKHRDVEINYMIRGNLKIKVKEVDYTINPNDFCIINSNDLHSTDCINPKQQVQYLVIMLSNSFLRKYMLDFDDYKFIIDNPEIKEAIRCELYNITRIINEDEKFAELHILQSLVNIIDILFMNCSVPRNATEIRVNEISVYDYISMTELYINEHYKDTITLNEIADYIGLSKNYFAKYFKLKKQKTFMQYLNEVRLANTIIDMENSDVNETVAALRNGFPSIKSFINTFKRVYHCTPTEYKMINKCMPDPYSFVKRSDNNQFS